MEKRLLVLFFVILFLPSILGSVYINEFVVDPQTDWSNSGSVTSSDEWFELYNDGPVSLNITGWNLSLNDSTPKIKTLFGVIPAKEYFTILNPIGSQNNNGQIILYDGFGNLIDSVSYGNWDDGNVSDNAPDGNADNESDECLARIPNGNDTDIDKNDFVKQKCTYSFHNEAKEVFIKDKVYEPNCPLETKNITLYVNITTEGSIDEVIFSVYINETWQNYTGSASSNKIGDYFYILDSNFLKGSQWINWTVYVKDFYNHTTKNGDEQFYVNARTILTIVPENPDGLNGWYITEPKFWLSNEDSTNIWYRWDSLGTINYNGSFGIENSPNNFPNKIGGKLELFYWSDICNEEETTETFYVDLVDPVINDLNPANNSKIKSVAEISAYLDNPHGLFLSGINTTSIIMKVNNSLVQTNISEEAGLDAVVSYLENISDGFYTVYVYVENNAGRSNEITWEFEVSQETFEIEVDSPDKIIYNNRRSPINISLSKEVEKLEYADHMNGGEWKRLCRNCEEYGFSKLKRKSFSDGWHNLSVRATDKFGNSEEVNDILFFVDSKKPKIYKTEPKRGFANGNFYVKLKEENPVNLTLFYGNESYEVNASDECVLGKTYYECDIKVNLTDYNFGEIGYWFKLWDVTEDFDTSRPYNLNVDTIPPKLNNPDAFYEVNGKYVYFNMNITEENFEEVSYSYIDSRGRLKDKRICSKLKNGICEKKKRFSRGDYNLTIGIIDEAGNQKGYPINFTIDY